MNVLYISYDGMTDPLGQSQVINYLIGLSKKGNKFDILSFEKPDKYASLKDEIKTLLDHNNIGWYPQIFHTTPPIFSKIYDRVKLLSVAKKLHKKNKYNLIHCRSYTAAEVGLQLKRETGVKFLFDMRGFWADEKADGNSWNTKKWFWRKVYNHYKQKEKEFVTEANHIISLTHAGKSEIQTWPFYDKNIPITVIPCCANIDFFLETDKSKKDIARKKLNITTEAYVISYLGSLGAWYMIDEMLSLFEVLLLKKPTAVFLIITNSDHKMVLQKLAAHNLPNDRFVLHTVPFSQVPEYMYASDISISFIKPVYSKISSSPVKIGEILSMGIPLIANGIGDTSVLLRENKVGALVENFDKRYYQNAVDEIDNLANIPPEQIRKVAAEKFSLKNGIEDYSNVYRQLEQSE